MDRKHLKKFLREQVYVQRNHYVRNQTLTEAQKFKKVVRILRETETIDEGLFDSLRSIVGGGSRKIKGFLARRVVSYLGVPSGHPLSFYFTQFLVKRSMGELQALFLGQRSIRREFAEYATRATMRVLEDDFSEMFGLKGGTFLGDALLDGITKAINSEDFQNTLLKNYYVSLGNMADTDLDSLEAGEDTDGDGVTDGDEQVAGFNPEVPDEPESIKQKVAATAAGVGAAGVAMKDKIAGTPPVVPAAVAIPGTPGVPDELPPEEPAELAPEETAELTAEQKLEQITEFVKRFTPGGSLGVVKDPSAEGIKKGWIPWVRVFRKHKEGESKGKVKNWEEVNKIYNAFTETAPTELAKIEALYKSKFIKEAGYEAIQAKYRGGTPEGDLESAKATGDLEKVAGAAAATVADTSVDDEAREDAGEALEDAIEDAPASEDPPPAEEDLIDVEELLAGLEEPAEAGEGQFPELEDENRHFDVGYREPGEEVVFGNVLYPPDKALELLNTHLKYHKKRDEIELFVRAFNKEGDNWVPDGVSAAEDHPDFKGKLIKPESAEDPEAEAEAAVQDTEADAADAVADDLERAAANEPEDDALKMQAADARQVANKEREEADEAGAYEEPTWQKNITNAREAALKAALAADPGGSPKLYRRGVNEFIDRMMDNWKPELRNKAENAKVVKQTKKMTADEYFDQNKHKYATEVWPGEVAKQLRGVAKSIKEKESTVGMAGVFNFKGADGKVIEVVPRQEELGAPGEAEAPEEPEARKYNQINVELHDDKTVVLTDRSMRGKIKRSKLGEGILSEQDWSAKAGQSIGPTSFGREGVTVVELPPIPVEKLAKIRGWGTATSGQKLSLTGEVYNLLKQKAESDPESVEDFDLGSDEETGKPNIVIMSLSTPTGERDKWSGVFDHRTPATPELKGELKALYSKLARNYVQSTTDKEMKSFAGDFNKKKAETDYPISKPGQTGVTLKVKKVLKLADEMGVEYTDVEAMDYVSGIIRDILIAGGSGTEFKSQEADVGDMSDEEEEGLEAEFEKSLTGGEELDEVFKISGDLLRRLLA